MLQLISDKLVELVEKHSDVILKRWTKLLLSDPTTSSFTGKHIKQIEKKARQILKNLSQWVSYDTTKEEIGRRFAQDGMELFTMGIPLCELHRSMVVFRRTLWLFVINESAFETAFELHQVRELNDRVVLFFDRAIFYLIRGYTEEMNRKIKQMWKLSSDDTESIFFEKSFYNQ